MPEPNLPPCRQNISDKQKDIHSSIIADILTNQLNKNEFDFAFTSFYSGQLLIDSNLIVEYYHLYKFVK